LIELDNVRINWKRLHTFKGEFTTTVAEQSEKLFEERGIGTFHGLGAFAGPNFIRVGERELTADQPVHKPDYGINPHVAFTVPAIAAIGHPKDATNRATTATS
jgi:pyruvate/2-oxoglutarate dehydrogenase complex dihydrolipoamide dehydrogenase (E3) component